MSSNDMPELGSKISLISKADIRYEGKLYTVDPQDCTIALANVRSFGTEDRKTAHPVPAQNQIYDYILFRATDIKDISVVPPTQLLCDPAIVQLSSSLGNRYGSGGSGGGGTGGGGGQQDYPSQMLGGLGGGYHHSGGSGGGGFNPMQSGLNPLSQQSRAPQSEFPVRQTVLHHNESVLDFLTGGGSRSSTPALRKPSPTVDQSTQANSRQPPPLLLHKDDKRNHMYGNRNQDMRDNRGDNRGNRNQYPQQQQQQQQQRTRNFQQYFEQQLSQNNMMGNRGGWPQHNMQQQHHQQQQQQHRNQNQQHQQQNGRIQSRQRNGRQFARAPGPRPKQPVQPLKFESDYDFDKANSEFEELKSEISKLKLSDSNTTTTETPAPLMNGDAEKTNKDDSGNETALATDGEQEDGLFYNKNKSFFDNISCEAIERSKGRSQRTDWRKERMLNSETFGVATARRGLYRGGRGGQNYYFGGNRGGYYGRGYRNQQVQQRYRTKSPAPARPQPQTATA